MEILGCQKRLESEGTIGKGATHKEDSRTFYGEFHTPLVWVESLHMQGEAGKTKQRRITMQT